MDLFDNKKETEKEESDIHEQLSLDFDLTPEGTSNTAREEPASTDISAPKEKKEKKKPKKKKKHPVGGFEENSLPLGVGSFGKYLQDMRVRSGYSIAQVEQLTRIKARYIELLEMEKLRLELPSVYVLAYARKLCLCYKVPVNEIASIIDELKGKLDSSFSHELIEHINIDYEIDEDNQKKIRHFAWLLLGGLLFFVALVWIAIFMLSAPSKPTAVGQSTSTAAAEKFDQKKLRVLQTPIIIEATELPAKTN
jgi:transcriptional regulator with XRE-family HTH domain